MRFNYCPYCGEKSIEKEVGDEGLMPFCPKCHIPLWDMFISCIICAVINKNDEIALLRQNDVSTTKYVCVAGVIKLGESAEETAIREIKEEIGLDVKELKYIQSYPYKKKEMLMIGYKAMVEKKDFKISKEVDSVEWVKFSEALEKLREGSIAWQLVKSVIENN